MRANSVKNLLSNWKYDNLWDTTEIVHLILVIFRLVEEADKRRSISGNVCVFHFSFRSLEHSNELFCLYSL